MRNITNQSTIHSHLKYCVPVNLVFVHNYKQHPLMSVYHNSRYSLLQIGFSISPQYLYCYCKLVVPLIDTALWMEVWLLACALERLNPASQKLWCDYSLQFCYNVLSHYRHSAGDPVGHEWKTFKTRTPFLDIIPIIPN